MAVYIFSVRYFSEVKVILGVTFNEEFNGGFDFGDDHQGYLMVKFFFDRTPFLILAME